MPSRAVSGTQKQASFQDIIFASMKYPPNVTRCKSRRKRLNFPSGPQSNAQAARKLATFNCSRARREPYWRTRVRLRDKRGTFGLWERCAIEEFDSGKRTRDSSESPFICKGKRVFCLTQHYVFAYSASIISNISGGTRWRSCRR